MKQKIGGIKGPFNYRVSAAPQFTGDGYRKLLADVMLLAIKDFVFRRNWRKVATVEEGRSIFTSASAWIFARPLYPRHVFTFQNICRYLGIDPKKARKAIYERRREVLQGKSRASWILRSFAEKEKKAR